MTYKLYTLNGEFVGEEKFLLSKDFTGIAKDTYFKSIYYYKDGQLHREDGPATEHNSGKKYWLICGKLHRLDGPACEWDERGYCAWFINNKQINCGSNEQFLFLVDIMRLKGLL